jgi:LuxR family maltose regulon positive regulatory protein
MKPLHISLSKITPPALPRVVPRKRLFSLIDQKEHYQVTWISGMAGSGKTTLVASYLDARDLPCLWYQMDEGDCDIATFFYYLGRAAKKASPGKRKPLPLLTPEYFMAVSVFAQRYFENLCARLTAPFVIVFDDYYKIPLASLFHEAFREGLSRISADIHVIVVSRTDPPPAFAGMIANNRMRIIGSDELLLTFEESKKIARIEGKSSLSVEQIKRIHEMTQGWAAGLILMAKTMRTGGSPPERFERFIPSEIFDYFSGEVFDKMDESTREFLLKAAFLPKMTAFMARGITECDHTEGVLSFLKHNYLFTEQFSTSMTMYQFHPLFREFLVSRAKHTFTPEEIFNLQRRAARLLKESNQVEDAVELFFEIGDVGSLIPILYEQAQPLLSQGRSKTLEQWIERLPQEILENHPGLLYWLGVSYLLHGSSDKARRCFHRALHLFENCHDTAGLYLAWSGLVDSIVNDWHYFTALDQWIAWLDDHPPSEHAFPSTEIEARLATSMATALLIRKPHHPDMASWLNRSLRLTRESTDVNLYMQARVWAMTYYAWIGDFAQIQILREETRQWVQSYKASPPMILHWRWLDISTRSCTMENIDSLPKDVSDALIMVEKTGIRIWEHLFLMAGIYVSLILRRFSSASSLIERFESVLDKTHYHEYGVFHHFKGLYNLLAGRHAQALAHAQRAFRIADETGYVFASIVCLIQVAYLLHKTGNTVQAQRELDRAHELSLQTKSTIFEFMCLAAKAKIELDLKKDKEVLELLRQCLSMGRENNYLNMVWWWNPSMMAKLCAKAITAGIEVEYVHQLIRAHKLSLEPPPHHIDNWPWMIKVYTLGRFQVLSNEVPIEFSGKAQRMPLDLLKVLIAYGGIEVGIEQIIDALWYDSEGDKAHSAFSTTLNRLRTLIAMKDVIQLRAGKVTLNQKSCWADVWAFERTLANAEESRQRGETADAISQYEKSISIYGGPFLEDGTAIWMIPVQERLKGKYLSAIISLGELLERDNRTEEAIVWYEKGLSEDNLEEALYQHLMVCFHKLGRPAEAIKTYRRCKSALQGVLGIGPSDETESIYREIVG